MNNRNFSESHTIDLRNYKILKSHNLITQRAVGALKLVITVDF